MFFSRGAGVVIRRSTASSLRRRSRRARSVGGCVGESGSGKSVTGFSILGLIDPARPHRGRLGASSKAESSSACRRRRAAQVARRHIAMVFQDPMMTLNPVLTHRRRRCALALRGARARLGGRQRARADRGTGAGRAFPMPRGRLDALSAPVLRRHAPARRHRDRAAAPAGADHLRRADHGARRLDPGRRSSPRCRSWCASSAPP